MCSRNRGRSTTMKRLFNKIPLLLILPLLIQGQAPTAGNRGGGGRGGGARGGVGTTPAPTSPVTGNAANGKKFYYEYTCYGCHGFNGETGRAFVGNWGNLQ